MYSEGPNSVPYVLENVFRRAETFDKDTNNNKKGRTRIQFGWKMTRLIFRPGLKLTRMKVDRPSSIRRKANPDEGRPTQKLIGRDRSRQKLSWPGRRSKQTRRDTRSRLVSMRKSKHEMRKDDPRTFDDQGDGRDEGDTCTMHEGLCSGGAKEAMTTSHGNAKGNPMIWWIRWRRWFTRKEWTSSKWRDKGSAGKAQERSKSKVDNL